MDGLPNNLIRNIPRKGLVQLTHIINAIMILQHFPKQWKHAIISPIPKPNKDPTKPESYRPISLLNSLSKLAERALLNRLRDLGFENMVPEEQFGFKRGHSTTLLVAKVAQDAINIFNRKESTVLLALDFSKAFDSVWLDGLGYKLSHFHQLPPYVVLLLHSYLMGRSFQVRVEYPI